VALKFDMQAFVEALDVRAAGAMPTDWPTEWSARSTSVANHIPWNADASHLEHLPLDVAIHFLVDWVNEAFSQFTDGVSEDAHEPYGGFMTIDGDLLRVRFGRIPRGDPDAAYLAPECDPIPIASIVRTESF
jgi:hypothetical protein